MSDMIMNTNALPEYLFSRISTEKVLFNEKNGIFTLKPIKEEKKSFDNLIGMFSDGKLSIDNYLREKQFEKELEK